MNYSSKQYESDLNDPEMPHLESRERFRAFYDELGKGPAQSVEYPAHRMSWVKFPHPARVLELGCHTGYNLIHWAKQHPETECVGVDISQTMLANAANRIKEAQLENRIELVESFIEDYVPDRTFTDVVLTETLEHVQDAQAVLDAVVPMLRPGTALWITVPSRRWGNYSHVRGIRAMTLAAMLQQAGLDVAEIEAIDERRVQGEDLTRCYVVKQLS